LEREAVKTRQLSVFVSNRVGRLAGVTRVLRDNGISIRALSMADAPDFGIFRVIVEEVDRATRALKAEGYVTDVTDVIAVEVDDRPGGLAGVLDVFSLNSLNVEYMYAFLTQPAGGNPRAIIFFRFEDTDAALRVLDGAAVTVLAGESLWKLVAGRGDASATTEVAR
jgi:hypothetical protein